MYFPRTWEFDSTLSKLRNFGGGLNPPTHPRYVTAELHSFFISVMRWRWEVSSPIHFTLAGGERRCALNTSHHYKQNFVLHCLYAIIYIAPFEIKFTTCSYILTSFLSNSKICHHYGYVICHSRPDMPNYFLRGTRLCYINHIIRFSNKLKMMYSSQHTVFTTHQTHFHHG
jgi:hypothetical protein